MSMVSADLRYQEKKMGKKIGQQQHHVIEDETIRFVFYSIWWTLESVYHISGFEKCKQFKWFYYVYPRIKMGMNASNYELSSIHAPRFLSPSFIYSFFAHLFPKFWLPLLFAKVTIMVKGNKCIYFHISFIGFVQYTLSRQQSCSLPLFSCLRVSLSALIISISY